jgi:hypothetical protein
VNPDILLSVAAVAIVGLTAWRKLRAKPAPVPEAPPVTALEDKGPDLRRLLTTWHDDQREQQRRTEECLRVLKTLVEQAAQLPPKS